jgi:TetR/AcrR family transcriptional regulator, fatty acid metabolism regulator protein
MAHSVKSSTLPVERVSGLPEPRAQAGADPEKRKRILAAAVALFGQRGFHEARIAEIAARAGVAEGTVYLYFRNKEDLLGAVFDDTMDEVLDKGREIASSDEPAAGRLVRMLDLHLSFLAADRSLASVFQIELRRSARLVERFSRSKLVGYFRMLEGVIRDGIARGEFRPDLAPRLAVRILFGAADEILSEWLLSGEATPQADARLLTETLFRGFNVPAGPEEEKPATRPGTRRRTSG